LPTTFPAVKIHPTGSSSPPDTYEDAAMARRLTDSEIRQAVSQAVGPHEAAAIMGLHWSVPARMLSKGWLSASEMESGGAGVRSFVVFNGSECDRNYREYDEKVQARGGMNDRRPRAWIHLREPMIRKLAAIDEPIAFGDAIGVREAAGILGVHPSFVPRMIKAGDIVGRRLHSRDQVLTRHRAVYICSRKSCLENAKIVRQQQHAGGKVGRPRDFS
jgi:hypothetical protein